MLQIIGLWTKIACTLQKTLLGLDFATIMLILLVRCVFYNKSQLGEGG